VAKCACCDKEEPGQTTSLLTGVVNLPIEISADNKQVGQQWILMRPQRFVPPAARASDK